MSTNIDLSKMVTKKDGYLQKSRAQKTTAFIFLGLGTASIITGAMMMGTAKNNAPFPIPPTDEKTYDGAGLIVLGMLVDLASIPFFISSSNNKDKAMYCFPEKRADPLRDDSLCKTTFHSGSFCKMEVLVT